MPCPTAHCYKAVLIELLVVAARDYLLAHLAFHNTSIHTADSPFRFGDCCHVCSDLVDELACREERHSSLSAHCSCACALVVHYNFARDEFVAQHIAAPRSVVLLAPVCAHFSCSEERHVNHTLLLCLGEVPKRHSVTSEEAVHYFRLAFLSDQTWHGVNQPLCVENNEVVATRHTWEIDHHAELLEHLQKHLNLDLRSG